MVNGYNRLMIARDLSTTLRNTERGWVAINEKNEIVVIAASFKSLCEKVKQIKEELTLVPAAKDYSGFIT